MSTSVVIVNLRDLEADIGGGRSTCETVVWNSRGLNARKMNFVPTIISQGTDTTINYYGFSSGYDSSYIQANQDSIRRWQSGLQRCFKAAIDAGEQQQWLLQHTVAASSQPAPCLVEAPAKRHVPAAGCTMGLALVFVRDPPCGQTITCSCTGLDCQQTRRRQQPLPHTH